jgi:hypothetical protein
VAGLIKASRIAAIHIQPVDNDAVTMVLTDIKGHDSAFLVNPETLNVVLAPLLGLATQWAEKPVLEIGNLIGPLRALPATQLDITRGRTADECALHVFVGRVEVTFLVPVPMVLAAMGALLKRIDPGIWPH